MLCWAFLSSIMKYDSVVFGAVKDLGTFIYDQG